MSVTAIASSTSPRRGHHAVHSVLSRRLGQSECDGEARATIMFAATTGPALWAWELRALERCSGMAGNVSRAGQAAWIRHQRMLSPPQYQRCGIYSCTTAGARTLIQRQAMRVLADRSSSACEERAIYWRLPRTAVPLYLQCILHRMMHVYASGQYAVHSFAYASRQYAVHSFAFVLANPVVLHRKRAGLS